jgi:hypothetical protein
VRLARALAVLALAASVALAGKAHAQGAPPDALHLRPDARQMVIADALVGGVAGAAAGGGVLGVMSVTGNPQRDWLPVLAASAGLGFVLGLTWGLVQSRSPPQLRLGPTPVRDGLSFADTHQGGGDRRGTVMLPVFGHGF